MPRSSRCGLASRRHSLRGVGKRARRGVHCGRRTRTALAAVGRSAAWREAVLSSVSAASASFAVQFARLAGRRVVAAERTQAKLDWARKPGVDEAILFQ